MTLRNDLPEIKQGLKDRIDALCLKLLPDGRRQGRLWVAHNPVTMDHAQSPEFKVALNRDIGAWIDWRTGEKGDVIRLVEYCAAGGDFRAALDWARDFLGLRHMSAADRHQMAARALQARQDAERRENDNRIKRAAAAEKLWMTGFQDGAMSTAEAYARRYFAARAIPLEQIPNRDVATMRFAEAAEFWPRAQYRYVDGLQRKVKDGPKYPAVLSAMRLPTGQVSAVHLTFLDPLGPRKLQTEKDENAKLMRGEAKGAVIRISHGPEGEPPETAREAHPVIIGEGIETTASVAIEAPIARAWAAGSLSNMANAPVWLPCVSSIVLLKDHFKSKTTEKQWDQVLEAMAKSGKPFVQIDSHVGNDFNDLMQEE
jgi:hypothetical protein